jgi:hypothetical protein
MAGSHDFFLNPDPDTKLVFKLTKILTKNYSSEKFTFLTETKTLYTGTQANKFA